MHKGVIHLVRTHKGGGGSSKSVHHAYKGGGGLHVEVRTQKRPFFARVLGYFHMLEAFAMLCCHWRRLSLPLIKHLL